MNLTTGKSADGDNRYRGQLTHKRGSYRIPMSTYFTYILFTRIQDRNFITALY